ncbi:leucine-rich repeat-containing protein 43-like [Chiloscyllium plagiosum]|uniref:leucine-rich repeat-containing protein 43-like n=1 Tax=Chiloscyllium plagiosum TaxID=36176 RepID=UPI001CB85ABA|nr:leucine-rich repeat-containing protein 43-like [Chiloscyllium plagiosum]
MDVVTAFKAFQQEMKALSLKGFPSGIGSWNSSRHSTKKDKSFKLLKGHGEKEKTKGKDVNEEEPEALKEYLTCEQSPWKTENVTPETQHLKELAITSPSLINERFLCSYLQSLRLVNKQICEVDKQMLKFQNLEELILSVNKITSLNSANLPRKLEILELCSNEISSLQQLSSSPPPMLQYLGLSYNKLSLPSDSRYLSSMFWPNLISLDLSFNDFVNLRDIVASLSSLPNLKNFILLGNPLALFPYYRGFTIDILQNLVSLDDVLISLDERHHFKGIASHQVFPHKVPQKPWGDPIVYNYTKVHTVKDLYALKQLLQNGLTVTVIEEKILSWPIETEDDKIPEASMKEKVQGPGKGDKGSAKNAKGQDSTKEKRKSPASFRSDPPIRKILGSYHMDLYSIVAGNHNYQTVCDLGVPKIEEKLKSPTPEIKETIRGKGDKKNSAVSKSRTSAKLKTPDSKKAKGKRDMDSRISMDITPKHLFVEFKLHLQQWLTRADAENEIYMKNTMFSLFNDA